ncbi:MAG TPA: transporter substrate-binding domain-containing protein [Aliidongia sp.]|uniref:substrate-binding periplasmic protein n=1 Tax=Aliidongia sp. TaxID=1914230 RepID=UPI002DDD6184|nr:transporter substrate-binding domain-containing protein [Aliidongia sp.]HEV2678396.1 transporter substrate-binding domain-containing protein [Aliidongia sp.]
MRRVILTVVAIASVFATRAKAEDFQGHFRPRPPEMTVENGKFSGPIKDVIEEALHTAGMTISWADVPFARSLKQLQDGDPVLVPRYNRTPDREAFSLFLGPIAVQKRQIRFAVRQGDEHRIKSYADLAALSIGVKRGTAYFDQFDKDKSLHREEAVDDQNLLLPLRAGHQDAAIVVDQIPFENAAKAMGWGGYAWADWKVDIEQGNYYAIAKSGPLAPKAAAIDAALKAMAANGRVKEIYAKYGLDPEHVE